MTRKPPTEGCRRDEKELSSTVDRRPRPPEDAAGRDMEPPSADLRLSQEDDLLPISTSPGEVEYTLERWPKLVIADVCLTALGDCGDDPNGGSSIGKALREGSCPPPVCPSDKEVPFPDNPDGHLLKDVAPPPLAPPPPAAKMELR